MRTVPRQVCEAAAAATRVNEAQVNALHCLMVAVMQNPDRTYKAPTASLAAEILRRLREMGWDIDVLNG